MKDWDPETAIEGLSEERERMLETEAQMAERVFREGLVPSAAAITHLAVNSTNEKTRFTAAQYVVERNLGRLADKPPLGNRDPLEVLADELQEAANNPGSTGPSSAS